MKIVRAFLMAVLVPAFSASISFAIDRPLLCRGPLGFTTSTAGNTTVVFFTRNAVKSGDDGVLLKPGTCAWLDRAVNSTEPAKIFIQEFKGTSLNPTFIAFTHCAQNPDCVIRISVHDVGNDHYEMGYNDASVIFPAF